MNSRLVISLLCAGAVALACSSLSRSDASASQTAKASKSARSAHSGGISHQSRGSGSHDPTLLGSAFVVQIEPHALRFALDLTNASKKNVELSFASGQTYDFSVIDSTGREVYRWGATRMFTQSVQNRTIDGGETIRFGETAEATLPHGRYTAVAVVKSTNYPVTERFSFDLR